jgi:hypothetical protein
MATITLPPWYPTEEGQILLSLDGVTFEAVTLVWDDDAELVIDDDDNLVVE